MRARNGEVSGAECEEMRKYGEMGSVKRERGQCKKRESVTRRESENLPYSSCVQLICTAHLYSAKHTAIVIRSFQA
jgi:hypothetical protein